MNEEGEEVPLFVPTYMRSNSSKGVDVQGEQDMTSKGERPSATKGLNERRRVFHGQTPRMMVMSL